MTRTEPEAYLRMPPEITRGYLEIFFEFFEPGKKYSERRKNELIDKTVERIDEFLTKLGFESWGGEIVTPAKPDSYVGFRFQIWFHDWPMVQDLLARFYVPAILAEIEFAEVPVKSAAPFGLHVYPGTCAFLNEKDELFAEEAVVPLEDLVSLFLPVPTIRGPRFLTQRQRQERLDLLASEREDLAPLIEL